MRTRLLAVILILVLSLPLVAGEEPAVARKRTVTKTFRNTTVIDIPSSGDTGPGDPYPSTIEVSGFKRPKILDVNVTLRSLTHTFANDIDVLLVGEQHSEARANHRLVDGDEHTNRHGPSPPTGRRVQSTNPPSSDVPALISPP